ncbi:hypothetical protein ACWKW1_25235 [Brevibacillus parabrevis]
MKEKKAGKPVQHPISLLEQLLLEYVAKNPNEKVTYLSLEKATGIGRNTWSRKMGGKIEKINAPLPIVNMNPMEDTIELFNLSEFVEAHYDNKDKLIASLTHLNNSFKTLHKKAKKAHLLEKENADLIDEIKNLKLALAESKKDNKKLMNQVKHYSELYRNIAASSTYSEKGLDNVIEFKKGDPNNESFLSSDLIRQFDMFKPK